MFSQITEFGFFEKNQFFHFLRPKNEVIFCFEGPKYFFGGLWPFFWPLEAFIGVVMLLTLLYLRYDFGAFLEKFTKIIPKIKNTNNVNTLRPCLQKPKNGEGPPKKYLGPSKWKITSILGLRKWKKWFFSKNPNSVIWLNIGGGSHSGPGGLDSDRSHG